MELCRGSGATLRSFSLGECEGGPHEFRGVRRAALLRALADQLAPGSLLTGCAVERVESTPLGAALWLGGQQVGGQSCKAVWQGAAGLIEELLAFFTPLPACVPRPALS